MFAKSKKKKKQLFFPHAVLKTSSFPKKNNDVQTNLQTTY